MGGDINADPTTVLGGGSIVIHRSGVAKRGSGSLAPETFALYQNYPNPFNPVTTIEYDIPQPTHVRLVVYDITGRQVAELMNGLQEAGYYEARLDANDLASGIYIYRLSADKFTTTRKLMVLK